MTGVLVNLSRHTTDPLKHPTLLYLNPPCARSVELAIGAAPPSSRSVLGGPGEPPPRSVAGPASLHIALCR